MKTWFNTESTTQGALTFDGRPSYVATYTCTNTGVVNTILGLGAANSNTNLTVFKRKCYLGWTAINAGTRTGFTAPVIPGATLTTDYTVSVSALNPEFSYPTIAASYINTTAYLGSSGFAVTTY